MRTLLTCSLLAPTPSSAGTMWRYIINNITIGEESFKDFSGLLGSEETIDQAGSIGAVAWRI